MEQNKSCSICSTLRSRTERVYSTPGVDLERNKCYSGVDPRLDTAYVLVYMIKKGISMPIWPKPAFSHVQDLKNLFQVTHNHELKKGLTLFESRRGKI